jgi:hypothetical protein
MFSTNKNRKNVVGKNSFSVAFRPLSLSLSLLFVETCVHPGELGRAYHDVLVPVNRDTHVDRRFSPRGEGTPVSDQPFERGVVGARAPRLRSGPDRWGSLRHRSAVSLPGRAVLCHLGGATTFGPGARRPAGAGIVRGSARSAVGSPFFRRRMASHMEN